MKSCLKKVIFALLPCVAAVFLFSSVSFAWSPDRATVVMPHRIESNHNLITREFCTVWKDYLGASDFKYVNKGGASGRVGLDYYIQQTAKDGSALFSCNFVTIATMYAQQDLPYNWMDKLVPVGLYAMEPGVFMVQSGSEYETVQDVIKDAKEGEPVLVGTSRWIQGETLLLHKIMEKTGAKFEIIPFGSGGATRAALMGGHIDMASRKSSGIKKAGGKLRAISIHMEENIVPEIIGEDVPTTDEALGFETLNVGSYRTMFVHKELKEKHPERYKKLRESLAEAKKDSKYINKAEKQGYPAQTVKLDPSPEELNDMVKKMFDTFDEYSEYY